MNRRGFLGTIFATATAPAFVKADVLMPVKPPIWLPGDNEIQTTIPREGMIIATNNLLLGDKFTIAGITGTFVITSIGFDQFASGTNNSWA